MKKFLIFCVLLVSIFIFNTKVYAMQRTNIFIDYYNQEFTTRYDSTFLNKLEELKETIDSYNIHERDYVITFNSYRIYVGISLPRTNYTNNYCTDYFIYTLKPSIVSSEYYIQYSINRAYCEQNGDSRASINGVEILVNDFNNNNYSTQLNTIRNLFINDQSSNASNLYEGYNISGYNSAWNNIGYNLYYNSVPFGANINPGYTIYYATKPIYFNNLSSITDTNNKTIQEVCNIETPSNQWTDAKFIYNDDTTSTELSCGSSITTYYEEMNNTPTYEFNQVSKYNNWTYQIKNFDTYFILNDSGVGQIELEQENYISSSEITSIKYYGKKCENNTCYWEELGSNNNLVSISNDTYIREEDSYIYQFNYNVDLGSYQKIKISFAILPKGNENYSITFRTTSNIYATITTDMNTIAQNYNLETIIIQPRTYKSYLINSKSEDILYYFYAKYPSYYMNGNLFTYKWKKSNNEVEQFQNYNEISIENYWLTIGNIQLGPNAENYLYMYLSGDNQNIFIHNIYFSDKVLYTESNSNVFIQTYQNQETQIIATKLPDMVISDMKNAEPADINGLIEKILEYEQYKNDWLELFYSIYDPLPIILKDILIIIYTMILCYAVFLIFKD